MIFERGQKVIVRPLYGDGPKRPACLMQHSPYYHRGQLISDGWYVSYTDAKEMWDCHGGWVRVSDLEVENRNG